MHILIIYPGVIPATKYGGTERVIWYLGRELKRRGHQITYLVYRPSYCDFASVRILDPTKSITQQIPEDVDVVHFNFTPSEPISKPYLITIHGNSNDHHLLDLNCVFVSRNHALRHGSASFIHNGLDWDDYSKPDIAQQRHYFHFLGKAAWRLKNVRGAINMIRATPHEKLKVLGGTRLNFNMGFRFTVSPRVQFYGMVGGSIKDRLLNGSKGLLFPVRWQEPFGLAIIESLYFGCPVFGTPYGSLPELVHAETGYLSNCQSALVNAIAQADQFSPAICSAYASDCFNARTMATAYEKRYNQVLNGQQLNATPPQLKELQAAKFLPWNE